MEKAIMTAADRTLSKKPQAKRKDYISENTRALIERRGALKEKQDWEGAGQLNKDIRKAAKADRRRDVREKLS
eukprot:560550-Lingulodinium_polyedra.AAC.1